jgi:hypothetical protein
MAIVWFDLMNDFDGDYLLMTLFVVQNYKVNKYKINFLHYFVREDKHLCYDINLQQISQTESQR